MHTVNDLFRQLGLPHGKAEIQRFIEQHAPIPTGVHIFEARFWNQGQRDFLRQALSNDSDWAIVVDQLNLGFHSR